MALEYKKLGAAGFKVVHQESLDYGQQGRCENRYEFGPQQQQQQQGRSEFFSE